MLNRLMDGDRGIVSGDERQISFRYEGCCHYLDSLHHWLSPYGQLQAIPVEDTILVVPCAEARQLHDGVTDYPTLVYHLPYRMRYGYLRRGPAPPSRQGEPLSRQAVQDALLVRQHRGSRAL